MALNSVRVDLPAGAPRLAVLGTAYALSDLAHAQVGTGPKGPTIEFRPKPGVDGDALVKEARLVFEGQVLRWTVAERGTAARAELTARMLALAQRPSAGPGTLTPEAEAGLKAILAESGAAEVDPRGIKTAWSDLRRKA